MRKGIRPFGGVNVGSIFSKVRKIKVIEAHIEDRAANRDRLRLYTDDDYNKIINLDLILKVLILITPSRTFPIDCFCNGHVNNGHIITSKDKENRRKSEIRGQVKLKQKELVLHGVDIYLLKI